MTDAVLRVPPNSIEAEQSVLGGLMLDPEAWDRVASRLDAADFYRRDHQLIFRAIGELSAKGRPCDAVTLGDWFESQGIAELVGGARYCIELANATPSAANVMAYVDIVRQKAMRRRLIDGCTKVIEQAWGSDGTAEELVDSAVGGLMRMQRGSRNAEWTAGQAVRMAWDHIVAARDAGGMVGVPTGLTSLDRNFGGLHPGDLYVIGARPAMGKTALLLGMTRHAAGEGLPVGLVSGEQPAEQVGQRLMALRSNVPAERMRSMRFEDDDWARLSESVGAQRDLPIWILDRAAPSIVEVARIARRWKREHGIRALYVDYLQRLTGAGEKRWEQVAEVARGLKNIARDLAIPVIALAQVVRGVEERKDKRPHMSDLCDSSEIEKEADQIATLYRDDYYHENSEHKGEAEIVIVKNRHGPTCFCRVAWVEQTMRFADLEPKRKAHGNDAAEAAAGQRSEAT